MKSFLVGLLILLCLHSHAQQNQCSHLIDDLAKFRLNSVQKPALLAFTKTSLEEEFDRKVQELVGMTSLSRQQILDEVRRSQARLLLGDFGPTGISLNTRLKNELKQVMPRHLIKKITHAEQGRVLSAVRTSEGISLALSPPNSPSTVRIFKANESGNLNVLRSIEEGSEINSAVFTQNGSHLITALNIGRARLWRTEDGRLEAIYETKGSMLSAQVSSDGMYIFGTSDRPSVGFWSRSTGSGRNFDTFGQPSSVTHRDGYLAFIRGAVAEIYDLKNPYLISPLAYPDLDSVALGPKGRYLVAASRSGAIVWWDCKSPNTPIQELRVLPTRVKSAVLDHQGHFVLTNPGDGSVELWKTSDNCPPVRSFGGHDGPVESARFSPDEELILTSTPTSSYIWHTGPKKRP